ncbi:MAG: SsrA-binding protein SmpB [Clostridia bacterium]|nr:SsrA-binding protein SmpB [Clostridia bacterium]MBQ8290298.1 SsrA-binding protein SmpB [Clostridia bacterium]
MAQSESTKIIAENRKARHDYFVIETYEAGVELLGTEVKSLRAGGVNMKDSYCEIDAGQMYALGVHISPYEQGNRINHEPLRPKRLLMHKREIMKLTGLISREGYTLVPLSLYFKGSRVKMAIGLCKGKKLYDKRDDMARRDAARVIEREMKSRSHKDD